jgi:hypothetical protein
MAGISKNRLFIAYPGNEGVKVFQITDSIPESLFDLSVEQLQAMADAKPGSIPNSLTIDDALAIVLTWMCNR